MMIEDIAQRAYEQTLKNGGITVDLQGHEPTQGYAYGGYVELEQIIPSNMLSYDVILKYMQDHESALAMPQHYLGIWQDAQSGNTFLDVSIVSPPGEEALKDARDRGQIAVWDIGGGVEIPTGATLDRNITSRTGAATGLHQSVLDQNAGRDLAGLPGPVNVPGSGPLSFHSHGDIQRVANEYNMANGLGAHPTDYVKVNPENAAKIAQEYEAMRHDPHDPQVRQAYDALVRETKAQYEHAVNNGYRFEFYPDHDPYPNSPREAVLDLHHNKHMYVYPTESGYGSEGQGDPQDHPLLADSGVRWNGRPVTHNDLFRAVHDFYGHAKEGLGFRADGEDNAYRQHAAMFSAPARAALASETRGQNSYVNFGPYGEHNQTATSDTIYAPQKAGLMASWTHEPDIHSPRVAAWDSVFAFKQSAVHETPSNRQVVGVPFHERPFLFTHEHVYLGPNKSEHYDIAKHLGLDTSVYGDPGDWTEPGLDHSHYRAGILDDQMSTVHLYPRTSENQPEDSTGAIAQLSEHLNRPLRDVDEEWSDVFKDLQADIDFKSHSYTREGSTRHNLTFEDADGWHLAAMIEPAPPGTFCRFHPHELAVTQGGGALMCPSCTSKYEQAILNTNKDMRLIDQQTPYMLSHWSAVWSLPEGYGLMTEQLQHGTRDNTRCLHCGHFGPMPLGVCPVCGEDDALIAPRVSSHGSAPVTSAEEREQHDPHAIDPFDEGWSGEFEAVRPDPAPKSSTPANTPTEGNPSGAHTREPAPTYSESTPMLSEWARALGLDEWESEGGSLGREANQLVWLPLTGERPSCKEFLMSSSIRETREILVDRQNIFSNIPGWDPSPFAIRSPDGTDGWDSWEKTGAKLEDFLMNPKSRPDLQTPEAQKWLEYLQAINTPKTDPLTPWLTREWKKGRIKFQPEAMSAQWMRVQGNQNPHEYNTPEWHQFDQDPVNQPYFQSLDPARIGHWADFYHSTHPLRQGLDIMKLPTHEMHYQVGQWDEAMEREAEARAKEGAQGEIVHKFPNGWTMQNLTSAKSLDYEGNVMGHCVGGYDQHVARGQCMIHSLRDPDGKPHVTMETIPQKFEKRPFDLHDTLADHAVLRGTMDPDAPPELVQLRGAIERSHARNAGKIAWMGERHGNEPFDPERHFQNPENQKAIEWQKSQPGYQPGDPVRGVPKEVTKLNEDEQADYLYWQLRHAHDAETGDPVIHGAHIEQIQGQGNSIPKPEYQGMIKDWLNTLDEDDKPYWPGGVISDADDLDEDMGGYHAHGDYGVQDHTSYDWDALVGSAVHGGWRGPDHQAADAIVDRAHDKGELGELANAIGSEMTQAEYRWKEENEHRYSDDEIAEYAGMEKEDYTEDVSNEPGFDPEWDDPQEFDEQRWEDDIAMYRDEFLNDQWENSEEYRLLADMDNDVYRARNIR